MVSDDHNHRGPSKKSLFLEQIEGYEKSKRLSKQFGVGLNADSPMVISVKQLASIYGDAAAEKALRGGRLILLCSDDRVTPPEDEEGKKAWVKFGLPGSGKLIPPAKRTKFFANLHQTLGNDLEASTYHYECGACQGDLKEAKAVGEEAHAALGLKTPLLVSGYTPDAKLKMSGDPHFHEGLGFVISDQPQFNAAALGMERHMHLGASAFEDTEEGNAMLNEQAQALFNILMGHGWGQDGFAEHPLQIKIVGDPNNAKNSASRLWERLKPTRAELLTLQKRYQHDHEERHEHDTKLFDTVVFDAPYKPSEN
jgi:hypothetical protein